MDCEGNRFAFQAHYGVTNYFEGGAATRDESYRCLSVLASRVQSMVGYAWAILGDWNVHVGKQAGRVYGQMGPHGLETPTTQNGKRCIRWLEATRYKLVDSYRYIQERGAWRHRNGDRYEVGFSVTNDTAAMHIRRAKVVGSGEASDHKAKHTASHHQNKARNSNAST